MTRPLRLEYPGALYHITSRGNERRTIYWEDNDYQLFLNLALFGTQKTAARRQYARFVAEGVGMESIWSDLKHQIFLGNEAFVDRQRELLEGQSLVEVSRQPLRKSIASLEVFMRGIYERYL